MASRKKNPISKEDKVKKKSEHAKKRLEKVKNDPDLLAAYKEKERLKYLKKKENGQRKCVKDMTPREHRKARKNWLIHTSNYRAKQKVHKNTSQYMDHNTPPSSEGENEPGIQEELGLLNQQPDNFQNAIKSNKAEAQRRSINQRKMRNRIVKKQNSLIANLRKRLANLRQKMHRLKNSLKKVNKVLSPRSKIEQLANDPSKKAELVKKALFGEVIETEILNKQVEARTFKEKANLKNIWSGQVSKKYKIWRFGNKAVTYKKMGFNRTKSVAKKNHNRVVEIIHRFYEEDINSWCAAGKKECITRKNVKKQKRYLHDSLKRLHQKFLKTNAMVIGYSLFCQLRPFWVVVPKLKDCDTCVCVTHANIDLKLEALKTNNILSFSTYKCALEATCCDRYSEDCLTRMCDGCSRKILPYAEFDNSNEIEVKQWKHVKELITDIKTKKERYVTKYKKEAHSIKPLDLIMQLEDQDLPKLFQHERNITHQYTTMKSIKDSVTEKDAVIHMDFSENYTTKCNQEIQAYHFGGSRTQISLHTVVVYTKDKTTSYCTVSLNLAHSAGAIWAHLQPVFRELPPTTENLHFLSDGPVSQYRNKSMFYILGCRLRDFYPSVRRFSWNYQEAGHGKGAPDGVGGICKSRADQAIAERGDITTLSDFVSVLREKCPGVKVFVIEDADIERVNNVIKENEHNQKVFKGTLQVHQVTGNTYVPNKIMMKSLSCFCNDDGCAHFKLGSLEYAKNISRLRVSEIFTDSEDDEPEASTSGPHNRKLSYSNGDCVLVKLNVRKREYRYAAVCLKYDDEDGELTVTFLKVCNEEGTEFELKQNDVADVPYEDVVGKLPVPIRTLKRKTVLYKFENPINVYEK